MGRKNTREAGEKPGTWVVLEGGASGDVAGKSDGAEGDWNPRRGASARSSGAKWIGRTLKKAEP